MEIALCYYYVLTNDTYRFDGDAFDENIDAVRAFFAGDTTVTVSVTNHVEPLPENQQSIGRRMDGHAVSVRCMMDDLRAENSALYQLLSPKFEICDPVEKKVEMLRYLLGYYFVCNASFNQRMNSDDYLECVTSYWGPYQFKFALPTAMVRKNGPGFLDLQALDMDTLAMYVIPRYYDELGAWDRESIRKNPQKMEKLTLSWLDKARYASCSFNLF